MFSYMQTFSLLLAANSFICIHVRDCKLLPLLFIDKKEATSKGKVALYSGKKCETFQFMYRFPER